jgi:hypothetical protein
LACQLEGAQGSAHQQNPESESISKLTARRALPTLADK